MTEHEDRGRQRLELIKAEQRAKDERINRLEKEDAMSKGTAQLVQDTAKTCEQLVKQIEELTEKLGLAERKLDQIGQLVSITPRQITVNGQTERLVNVDDVVDFMLAIAKLMDASPAERSAFKSLSLGIGDVSNAAQQLQEKRDVEPA